MKTHVDMNTLSQILEKLRQKGLDNEIKMTDHGKMQGVGQNKIYNPDDLTIIKTYRFEGDSDPADNSVLYLLEDKEGQIGYILDAYGMYSSQEIAGFDDFLKKIPTADRDMQELFRNESAFTEIYNRYWDKLYYIAHKLLKDTEASEEIVQEIFLVLWKKRQNLNILSLTQYLSAMTRYAVYRHIAKEKKYSKQENSENLLQTEVADEIDLDNKILLEIITKLSNKLPEKCRLVFQYNKIQDQSLQEVAQQLNITQKTAEAHLTKALRVIRANFGDVTHLGYILISFLFLKK
eukprot:gene4681-5467_t